MDHWNNLWGTTEALSSFAEGEMAFGYKGAVADYWSSVFEAQTPQAVVADLCCGNGALLLAAASYSCSTDKDFMLYGIDAAQINFSAVKQQLAKLTAPVRAEFLGDTSIEKLPLASQSVDLAISQFGFEYTDLDMSLTELHRVLKSGTSLHFIAHHPESFISTDCSLGVAILSALMDQYLYFDLAISLIELTLQLKQKSIAPAQVPAFAQVNQALLAIMQKFNQNYQSAYEQEWYSELFRQTAQAVLASDFAALERVKALKVNTGFHLQRLVQQQAVALTPEQLDQKLAAQPGLFAPAVYTEIKSNEGLIGLAVKLTKI
ncbi:class I SAM-dependent methyltransferase [Rheinheimera sediminis]|uniref:class I SAM-dependent methyltransferase n=1 Tax=Rheinheimera sp. YQF-1 TaxID=2499626 RepID=UPI000FD90C03|nr:class I SAM-dependent methyltransferase [Rheinheimera sp. YQF-1]RVT46217.1 class I SAM-dependent methyltransferase [Rheinheimera sp. YQF-1]